MKIVQEGAAQIDLIKSFSQIRPYGGAKARRKIRKNQVFITYE